VLIGAVAVGAMMIAGIGFAGSYTAVRDLALRKGFGVFAYAFPVGVDVGIAVLLALDLVLTWLRIPFPLLRQAAWLLTAGTIVFNAAASYPDPLGMGMHAIIPVLFVVVVEAARHAVGRIADITADRHMESVRLTRWLLAPTATFRLWRRMKLWELRSYEEAVRQEQHRLVYRSRLRARYGRGWRRAAPVEDMLPLKLARFGVPLPPALGAGEEAPGRVAGAQPTAAQLARRGAGDAGARGAEATTAATAAEAAGSAAVRPRTLAGIDDLGPAADAEHGTASPAVRDRAAAAADAGGEGAVWPPGVPAGLLPGQRSRARAAAEPVEAPGGQQAPAIGVQQRRPRPQPRPQPPQQPQPQVQAPQPPAWADAARAGGTDDLGAGAAAFLAPGIDDAAPGEAGPVAEPFAEPVPAAVVQSAAGNRRPLTVPLDEPFDQGAGDDFGDGEPEVDPLDVYIEGLLSYMDQYGKEPDHHRLSQHLVASGLAGAAGLDGDALSPAELRRHWPELQARYEARFA